MLIFSEQFSPGISNIEGFRRFAPVDTMAGRRGQAVSCGAALARPSECWMLRMLVSRRFWRIRCFRLGAGKFGEGVAQVLGKCFVTSAGFCLLPILMGGDRLDDFLLNFRQLAERQRPEIAISYWVWSVSGIFRYR